MIFDTHCHLNSEEIFINIDKVLASAKENGVTHIIVPGWDVESSLLAIKIAEKYENVYAAIGIHPTDCYELTDLEFKKIIDYVGHPKVVAIGEIGLDYHWCDNDEQKEKQKYWFDIQITLANENHLPIIIHNRDASEDCLKILKNNNPINSGVMHCYSGSVEMLKDVINLNLLIGLDGPVTYKNAKTPKAVAENIPLDRLLVETDSPYLSPTPKRGEVNEPANIIYVIEEIAKIKNIDLEILKDKLFHNACKLFNVKNER